MNSMDNYVTIEVSVEESDRFVPVISFYPFILNGEKVNRETVVGYRKVIGVFSGKDHVALFMHTYRNSDMGIMSTQQYMELPTCVPTDMLEYTRDGIFLNGREIEDEERSKHCMDKLRAAFPLEDFQCE